MALPVRHFKYELRTQAGVLLAQLPRAYAGSLVDAVNEPSVLTFCVPGNSSNAANLIRSNEVWLYDSTDTLVNKFRIVKRSVARESDGKTAIHIQADDYLAQLSEEIVSGYETATTGDTVTNIIQSLLAEQVTNSTYDINYDAATIDSTLGALVRTAAFDNQTILRALLSLIATLGSAAYIYVNPSTRKLHLVSSLAANTGQEIRFRKNLSGVTQEVDYATLCTRLYMYGANASSNDDAVIVRLPPVSLLPQHIWTFNGTPNDIFALAATTHDFILVNTPGYSDRGGPVGGDSLVLDGSNQYAYNGASKARQYASHTVSGWFKLDVLPATSAAKAIYTETSTTDADTLYAIEVYNNAGITRLRVRIVDNAGVSQLSEYASTGNLSTDTWYHFAVTDTAAGTIRGYLNGTEVIAATAYTGTLTIDKTSLGAMNRAGTITNYLDGELASVRVHSSVMTAAQALIDATAANEFMDSTQQATYGLVPRVKVDRTLTHPDTLLLAARAYLEANDTPLVSYRVDAVNLPKADRSIYSTLGSELTTNGTFTGSSTGWTRVGLSYASNKVVNNNGVDGGTVFQEFPASTIAPGERYKITYEISGWTTGAMFFARVYNASALARGEVGWIAVSSVSNNYTVPWTDPNDPQGNPSAQHITYVTAGDGTFELEFIVPGNWRPEDTSFVAAGLWNVASVAVDNISLKKYSSISFPSHESIPVGATIRIVDEGLSLTVEQAIVKKTLNLDHPVAVSYEIENRTRLFTDPNAVYDLTQLLDSQVVDTIGAGQVIVKGDFTVLDWTDGSTTTIHGDNITTGTVSADTLEVSVTGGVIKSGATAYKMGTGFWLENNSGSPRLSMTGSGAELYIGDNVSTGDLIADRAALDGYEDGTFTGSADGWLLDGFAYNSNNIRAVSQAVGKYAARSVSILPGVTYSVAYTLSGLGGSGTPGIRAYLGGTGGTTRTANGTYVEDIIAGSDSSSAVTLRIESGTNVNATIDGVTVTGPNGGYMSWKNGELSVGGNIRADAIYAGVVYADRMPILDNLDLNGERVQTVSAYGGEYINAEQESHAPQRTDGTDNTKLGTTHTFYVPSATLPVIIICSFRVKGFHTKEVSSGSSSTWTIRGVLDGSTTWFSLVYEGTLRGTDLGLADTDYGYKAVPFYVESVPWTLDAGVSHSFRLDLISSTFYFSQTVPIQIQIDEIRVMYNSKGEHYVV